MIFRLFLLVAFVSLTPNSPIAASGPGPDPATGNLILMGLSENPDGMSEDIWKNLTSAAQEAKLLPSPSGVAGIFGNFGFSVALDGDRALVGGPGLAATGAAIVLEDAGSGWAEVAILRPSDGQQNDEFGYSVSLSGDRALVTAWMHDANGIDSGSAYVFEYDGTSWIETAKLSPADGAESDQFGNSVSLSANRALVGARFDDDNGSSSGSAYVFEFDGISWVETAKLTSSNGAEGDNFGFSVSLAGDHLAVGAPYAASDGSNTGSAYIYEFDGTNWIETTELIPGDAASNASFGLAVSLLGNRALVGAAGDDGNGGSSGSAYVFEFDGTGWTETAKLIAADGASVDWFGATVSLSGNRALIGAPGDDDNGPNSGSAYLFEFDGIGWLEMAKLAPSDGEGSDSFGSSISLSGQRALIGAHQNGDNGVHSGASYVFDFDDSNWSETAKLTPLEGATNDQFGYSVSLSSNRALVGSPLDDDSGVNSGAAYIFDFEAGRVIETTKLIPADGSPTSEFGLSVSLAGNRALIGAYGPSGSVTFGAAYVFEFDGEGWVETAALTPADRPSASRFGTSVSLSGDRALVGAFSGEDNGIFPGSAHVFDFDGANWSETAVLTASDGADLDRFGISVSLSGDRALIGAHEDDDNGPDSGSAYIFEFDGLDWSETAKITAADGTAGIKFGASVSLSGDRALVGAPLFRSAYVFDFDGATWSETAKLTPTGGASNSEFGSSVSLSDERALVGARWGSDSGVSSGLAYAFSFDGKNWSETAKLAPSDGATFDGYGQSVSLVHDFTLIGAPGDDDHGTDSGSAYLWNFELIFADAFESR